VTVSVPSASIDVSFDPEDVDLETIKLAIEEQGYAVAG
jgi:copper chaperone CopZ